MRKKSNDKKLTRRISLPGLFRSKTVKETPSVPSLPSILDTSSQSSLGRHKTISDKMGKLVRKISGRKKPVEDKDDRDPKVSSMYMEGGASDRAESYIDLDQGKGKGDETRASTSISQVLESNRRGSPDNLAPRIDPFQYDLTNKTILASGRCALLYMERLRQGTLTVSNQDIIFRPASQLNHRSLIVPYPVVVAVIPNHYYGTGAIHLATQRKLLKFVLMPNRDELLKQIIREWTVTCRNLLLKAENETYGSPKATYDQLEEVGGDGNGKMPSQRLFRNDNAIGLNPKCRCIAHYKHLILNDELSIAPIQIASLLFGDPSSDPQSSLSDLFFASHGGTIMKEEKWTVPLDDSPPHRFVIANIPDVFNSNRMMRMENEQIITRQNADVIVVDSLARFTEASFGDNFISKSRWCISRKREPKVITTKVILCMEVEASGKTVLPLMVVEEKLVEYAKNIFNEILKSMRTRLEVSTIQNSDKFLRGPTLTVKSILKEIEMFILAPFIFKFVNARSKIRTSQIIAILASLIIVYAAYLMMSRLAIERIDSIDEGRFKNIDELIENLKGL